MHIYIVLSMEFLIQWDIGGEKVENSKHRA